MTWPRQRGYPLKGMRGCRSRDRCRPLERLARETGPRRANRWFRRALRPMSWPRLDDKSTGRENVSLVEPLRRGGREGEEEGEIFRRSSSIHSARGHLGPRSARLAPFLLLSSFLIPIYFASFFFLPRSESRLNLGSRILVAFSGNDERSILNATRGHD